MPKPWPAVPTLPTSVRQQPRRWYRHSGRLALAAAVSFFLLGYVALAHVFPRTTDAPGVIGPGGTIGKGDSHKLVLPPTHKGPGKVTPGGNDTLRIQPLPLEIVPLPSGRQVETRGYTTEGPRRTTVIHAKLLDQ
jgi:hypothetical protein